MTVSLTQFAAEQQRRFDETTLPRTRREQGHFGTAPAIAEFMAEMFTEFPKGIVRILDPGAGVGTLSAAVCQRVLRQHTPQQLDFELFENDPKLIPLLEKTMAQCKDSLRKAGHQMSYMIRIEDFILANRAQTLFESSPACFDLAILNPPYFKIRKESKHSQIMPHVVHGQPNIYAFFMAAVTDLLRNGGQMVAITPRSYFNGQYFKRFRKWFFDRMTARQIHIFESRSDAFHEDAVLQENVILLAEKGGKVKDVVLTSSAGRDFLEVGRHALAYEKVIEDSSGDHLVRVATNRIEQEIVQVVDRFPRQFRELPFRISTGPVVTFRSREFLRQTQSNDTAPLLWMHNVRPFVTRFLPKNGKPAHIVACQESQKLLVPAKRYVLLKRFTTKEEHRRLVAGIVEARDSYSPVLGLENHLNYIYKECGELSKIEAFGLAAFFNSRFVDLYFRAISGNTQVNASEIRTMSVPPMELFQEIGTTMGRMDQTSSLVIERIVGAALSLPKKLITELCEGPNGQT